MEEVEYLEEYVEEYPNAIPQILNNSEIEEFLHVNEDASFDLLPVNTHFDEFIEEDPLVKRYRNDFERSTNHKKYEDMTTFNDHKATFRNTDTADSSTHKESLKHMNSNSRSSSHRSDLVKVLSCKTIDTSAIRNRNFPFNTIPSASSIHASRKPNLIQVTKSNKFFGQPKFRNFFGSYTRLNLNKPIDPSLNRIVAVRKPNSLIGGKTTPKLKTTTNIFGSFNEKIIKYKKQNPQLFPVKEPEPPKPVPKLKAKPIAHSFLINKNNRSLCQKFKKSPAYKPNLNVKKFSRYASRSTASLEMSEYSPEKDNTSLHDEEVDGEEIVETEDNNICQNDDSDKDSFDGLVETLNEYIDDESNNATQQTIKLNIEPNIIDQGTHYIKIKDSHSTRQTNKNFGKNSSPTNSKGRFEETKKKKFVISNRSIDDENQEEDVRNKKVEHKKPNRESKIKSQKHLPETIVFKKVEEKRDSAEITHGRPVVISNIKIPKKALGSDETLADINITKQKGSQETQNSMPDIMADIDDSAQHDVLNTNIEEIDVHNQEESSIDDVKSNENSRTCIGSNSAVEKIIPIRKLTLEEIIKEATALDDEEVFTTEAFIEEGESKSLSLTEDNSKSCNSVEIDKRADDDPIKIIKNETKNKKEKSLVGSLNNQSENSIDQLIDKIVEDTTDTVFKSTTDKENNISNKKIKDVKKISSNEQNNESHSVEIESPVFEKVSGESLVKNIDISKTKEPLKENDSQKPKTIAKNNSNECIVQEKENDENNVQLTPNTGIEKEKNLKNLEADSDKPKPLDNENKTESISTNKTKEINDCKTVRKQNSGLNDTNEKEDNLDDVDEIENILAEIDSVMESIHCDENKIKENDSVEDGGQKITPGVVKDIVTDNFNDSNEQQTSRSKNIKNKNHKSIKKADTCSEVDEGSITSLNESESSIKLKISLKPKGKRQILRSESKEKTQENNEENKEIVSPNDSAKEKTDGIMSIGEKDNTSDEKKSAEVDKKEDNEKKGLRNRDIKTMFENMMKSPKITLKRADLTPILRRDSNQSVNLNKNEAESKSVENMVNENDVDTCLSRAGKSEEQAKQEGEKCEGEIENKSVNSLIIENKNSVNTDESTVDADTKPSNSKQINSTAQKEFEMEEKIKNINPEAQSTNEEIPASNNESSKNKSASESSDANDKQDNSKITEFKCNEMDDGKIKSLEETIELKSKEEETIHFEEQTRSKSKQLDSKEASNIKETGFIKDSVPVNPDKPNAEDSKLIESDFTSKLEESNAIPQNSKLNTSELKSTSISEEQKNNKKDNKNNKKPIRKLFSPILTDKSPSKAFNDMWSGDKSRNLNRSISNGSQEDNKESINSVNAKSNFTTKSDEKELSKEIKRGSLNTSKRGMSNSPFDTKGNLPKYNETDSGKKLTTRSAKKKQEISKGEPQDVHNNSRNISAEVKDKNLDSLSDKEVENIMTNNIKNSAATSSKETRLARKRKLNDSSTQVSNYDQPVNKEVSMQSPVSKITSKRKRPDTKNRTEDTEKPTTENKDNQDNLLKESGKVVQHESEELVKTKDTETTESVIQKPVFNTDTIEHMTDNGKNKTSDSKQKADSAGPDHASIEEIGKTNITEDDVARKPLKNSSKNRKSSKEFAHKLDVSAEASRNVVVDQTEPINEKSDASQKEQISLIENKIIRTDSLINISFSTTSSLETSSPTEGRKRRMRTDNRIKMLASALNDSMLVPKSEKRVTRNKAAAWAAKTESIKDVFPKPTKDFASQPKAARIIRRRQSNLIQVSRKEYEKVLRENRLKKKKEDETKVIEQKLQQFGFNKQVNVKLRKLNAEQIKILSQPKPIAEALKKSKNSDRIETTPSNSKRKVKVKKIEEIKLNTSESKQLTPKLLEQDKNEYTYCPPTRYGRAKSSQREIPQQEERKNQNQKLSPSSKSKKGMISVIPLNDRVSRRDTSNREQFSGRQTRARSVPRNVTNIQKEEFNSSLPEINKNKSRNSGNIYRSSPMISEIDETTNKYHNLRSKTPTPTLSRNENKEMPNISQTMKTPHKSRSRSRASRGPPPKYQNEKRIEENAIPISTETVNASVAESNNQQKISEKPATPVITENHTKETINNQDSLNKVVTEPMEPDITKQPVSENLPLNEAQSNDVQKETNPDPIANRPVQEPVNIANQAENMPVPVTQSLCKNPADVLVDNLISSNNTVQSKESANEKPVSSTKSEPVNVAEVAIMPEVNFNLRKNTEVSTLSNATINKPQILHPILPPSQTQQQQLTKPIQSVVRTTTLQPQIQTRYLPANVVVETVFMTREEYDRKNLKKIITPPPPSSFTGQLKQKPQSKNMSSIMETLPTTANRINTASSAYNYRDSDMIIAKISDLLENQIKSESRLRVTETEGFRRKSQRLSNISKMKFSSDNALQVLVFLQNYFFNVSTTDPFASQNKQHRQQQQQQQQLQHQQQQLQLLSTAPSSNEPSSSALSSLLHQQETSNINETEKCFSFKKIRLQKQPEQIAAEANNLNLEKNQKSAKSPYPNISKPGSGKRLAPSLSSTSETDKYSCTPAKVLRPIEKPQVCPDLVLNLMAQGGAQIQKLVEKEPEEILPDFSNVVDTNLKEIKKETPDESTIM